MNWLKGAVVLILAVLIVIIACLARYEIIGVPAGGTGNNGIAYRLDRWTGEVVFIQGFNSGVAEIK